MISIYGTLFDMELRINKKSGKGMKRHKILVFIFLTLSFSLNLSGQFYNGHQMTFGKNRVQYFDYYWSFYRFDYFDCYFNEYGRDLAQYTADYATKKLEEIEDFFDYTLEKRLIFIIYNKNAEYKQSNIGLVTGEEITYNTGGYSRIIKNKVSLYYEGDHVAFQKQIASAITEVIINEMLYDADVRDRTSSSTSINMPDWFLKGLSRYVGYKWDIEAENKVKDGFSTGRYKRINNLEYDDAEYAGLSFWRFIGKEYGDALIPNIIYITKIYKKVNDGLLYVTGKDMTELIEEWQAFYKEEYESDKNLPGSDGNIVQSSKKEQVFQQISVSPAGDYIAFVTNDWGRKRIWLYNQTTGKKKIIFRAEPRYEHVTDKTYPVLAWHPNGRILSFINDEKSDLVMYFYRIAEKSFEQRNFLYFDKVLSFSYAPDGTRIVLSGVKDGNTDIYVHTIASGTNEQITADVADDLDPSFIQGTGESIIFSSNRLTDTISSVADPFERTQQTFDLFTYDLSKNSKVLNRLTEGNYISRFAPVATKSGSLSYTGDADGVLNRFKATFDSTISYIDTSAHYRYFIESKQVTNYDRNITSQSLSPGSDFYGEVLYSDGRYRARKGTVSTLTPLNPADITKSNYRKELDLFLHKADSVEQIRKWLIEEDKRRRDTLTKPLYEYYENDEPINISHYIFEKEKQNYYDQLWRKDYMDIDLDTGSLNIPTSRIYQTSFYNNYIANQIDFNFLNNTYQVYSGGAPYFNPGVNVFTRIGVIDMFENIRLTGGFRFSGNFDSNEYLVSLENLKGKFDKQLIFHRQGFFSSNDTALFKTHTHTVYLSYAKAFTPVLSLKGTLTYRNDRYVFLPTDMLTLDSKNIYRHWAGIKGELIYDNTRSRAVNIYYGTRFKIFGEYYKEVTRRLSDLVVIGVDFRKYTRIHRELIWANRIAASASYGPSRLIYYLGGVDNWMGYLFNKYPMFDNTVPVDQTVNYGFQALATNMRGFSQNARNGDKFVMINSEIRWPFVRYFAGHPLRSNFLNSLQVVGFGDIGTAWSGRSPWSGESAWENEVVTNGPVVVTIDSFRDPIVAGFGAGARAQILGYFVRADWAWGIESNYLLPRIFYLSFSLDF